MRHSLSAKVLLVSILVAGAVSCFDDTGAEPPPDPAPPTPPPPVSYDPGPAPPKPQIVLRNVPFKAGSTELDRATYADLDAAAEGLWYDRSVRVAIEGYSDSSGSDEANLLLSERRAAAVRDYLEAKGIEPERLEVIGRGESQPVVDGSSPQAQAQNRRVEFTVAADAYKAPPFEIMRVFYGTDRARTGSAKANDFYGKDRGELELGWCDVSIPPNHQKGELEQPVAWLPKWLAPEKPHKHVVLLEVVPKSSAEAFGQIRLAAAESPRRDAFVFIHGFNVDFKDAARRTAQMAVDLDFAGAPVFFSWPSQGDLENYTGDLGQARFAITHLKQFLADLHAESKVDRLHVIAHSMGSQLVADVLTAFAAEHSGLRVSEIVLAAPDIDAAVFRDQIVPKMAQAAGRVTLYASSGDWALEASRKLNVGNPRAGQAGDALVVVSGVDTIDASLVDTSLLGHGYFAEQRSIIDDILLLLKNGHAPDARALKAMDRHGLKYWAFPR